MYEFMSENSKTEVCLWCDGYCDDNENCQSQAKEDVKRMRVLPLLNMLKGKGSR